MAFVSLDRKGFNYWEATRSDNRKGTGAKWNAPITRKRIQFKSRKFDFLQTLCYIPCKQMYLGAGLDMLIHVYDKNLSFLTTLPSGERVIR